MFMKYVKWNFELQYEMIKESRNFNMDPEVMK